MALFQVSHRPCCVQQSEHPAGIRFYSGGTGLVARENMKIKHSKINAVQSSGKDGCNGCRRRHDKSMEEHGLGGCAL